MPHTIKPDLFHAVDGGGNCLPGPARPFSLVRCGPDTLNHNTSGYASGEDIMHFSHTHVSGTGGQGRYGNIGIAPWGYNADERAQGQMATAEIAEPGYYSVALTPRQGFGEMALPGSIRCELTATHHCALHRYQFNEQHEAHLRFNIGACIGGRSIGGMARWINSREMIAYSICRGGWGHDLPYTVFAHIELDCDVSHTDFTSADKGRTLGLEASGAQLVGRASLGKAKTVTVKVGISLVSNAQAQRNLADEIGNKTFEAVRAEAHDEWQNLLNRFQVSGGSEQDKTLWQTLWMRLYTMPSDLGTTEVPWFHAKERQFNDLYALWDSVRGANSLFALVDPQFAADLCRSLMEISEQTGWLPDAWITGGSGDIQGGCSSAVLFADAMLRELPGIEANRALQALNKTQESASPNPAIWGRYPGWQEKGYLDTSVPNCCSRSVEYAFQDHATAIVAEHAGDSVAAETLRKRSQQIWDSWHSTHHCFAPRNAHGEFVPFNPWKPARRDFWNDPHFYEGTGHDYALTSWHLIDGLIDEHGGAEAFAAHLDQFLERCYIWKEINLHAPWLYHACGLPHRSTLALRQIMDAHVKPGRNGLSDNEDMGAWSSWWLSAAMGLFPVPANDLYLLGCPRFSKTQITLGLNRGTLTITTQRQPEPDDVVVAAKINGTIIKRAWLRHSELMGNCHIQLEIGKTPSEWGKYDLPPWGE